MSTIEAVALGRVEEHIHIDFRLQALDKRLRRCAFDTLHCVLHWVSFSNLALSGLPCLIPSIVLSYHIFSLLTLSCLAPPYPALHYNAFPCFGLLVHSCLVQTSLSWLVLPFLGL